MHLFGIDPLTDLFIIIMMFFTAMFIGRMEFKKRGPVFPGNPLLLAYYTNGKKVMTAHEGTTEQGMHYTAIYSGSPASRADYQGIENSLIYRVELPYQSQIHLMGIPKNGYATLLEPVSGPNKMEPVDLEGDFGNYFSLYTDKGNQVQARYLLDPKTMAFIVDFCMSHSWEIINDEFYFVKTIDTNVENDPTDMFDDIQRFADEIRPAIEVPLKEKVNLHRIPYNRTRTRRIACPLCHEQLVAQSHYYACPKKHGKLISGGQLLALKEDLPADFKMMDQKHAVDHREVNCPFCNKLMSPTPYNGTVTIIDTCTNCPYRWIDAGELQAIIL
jgi:Zn-finger nucleic acid-binding protein